MTNTINALVRLLAKQRYERLKERVTIVDREIKQTRQLTKTYY